MKNESKPAVSVIMPVYNAERFLSLAVESILEQTFADFEFIVINDGSTDNSLKKLEFYADKDKRIILFSRENRGLVRTLNEGLVQAAAPLIARMDADDIAFPTRFEKQIEYLERHDDCVLLGTKVVIIDPDGDEICEMGEHSSHEEIEHGFLMNKGQIMYHPSVIMRRYAVDMVGGYSEKYPHVEDLDLFLKLAEIGKIKNLQEPLLKYREHFSKVGFVNGKEQQSEILELLDGVYKRRGLANDEVAEIERVENSIDHRILIWGWWALNAGNIGTARKYAKKLLLSRPFSIESWNLLFCSLRGY